MQKYFLLEGEQQNIEKALAKKSLLEAREKRTIVETKQSPNLNQKSEINIVKT